MLEARVFKHSNFSMPDENTGKSDHQPKTCSKRETWLKSKLYHMSASFQVMWFTCTSYSCHRLSLAWCWVIVPEQGQQAFSFCLDFVLPDVLPDKVHPLSTPLCWRTLNLKMNEADLFRLTASSLTLAHSPKARQIGQHICHLWFDEWGTLALPLTSGTFVKNIWGQNKTASKPISGRPSGNWWQPYS